MSQYDKRWTGGRNQYGITEEDMREHRERIVEEKLGGFSQEQLNIIWESFEKDNPVTSAFKLIDDKAEQSMSINTNSGEILVTRKPKCVWRIMPRLGAGQ